MTEARAHAIKLVKEQIESLERSALAFETLGWRNAATTARRRAAALGFIIGDIAKITRARATA